MNTFLLIAFVTISGMAILLAMRGDAEYREARRRIEIKLSPLERYFWRVFDIVEVLIWTGIGLITLVILMQAVKGR